MRTFLSLILLEIKIILRSKISWILAVFSTMAILLPILSLLFGQFLLVYHFIRDKRTSFSGILCTLPHTTPCLYLARAAAAFILLFALWPFMLAILAFFPELEPAPWIFTPGYVLFLTLKYFILCLIQVGLVSFFSLISRQILLLYFLIIASWNKTLELASNLAILPSFSKLFVFGQGFMLPSAPSLAVGYFPDQDLYYSIAIFQAGLALLFITSTAIREAVLRSDALFRSRIIAGLTLISLTFLIMGSHNTLKELRHREQGFYQLIKAANTKNTPADNAARFTPESYNLAVQLKSSAHYFRGTATITGNVSSLKSKCLLFTLRDCFSVTSVSDAASQKQLAWKQNRSTLAVYLPETYQENSTLKLSISYSGEVWEWFPDRMAQPSGPVNFIAASYSLLRSGYAWYPIPGANDLYTYFTYENPITDEEMTSLHTNRTVHAPLPFSMTVDIDTDNMVASNLEPTNVQTLSGEYRQRYSFHSEQGRDVFLLAGPYQHQIVNADGKKVSVYNFPLHQAQLERVVNSLSKLYSVYDNMFYEKKAVPASYTVVEIPPFLLYSEDGLPRKNLTLTDTVVLSENYFKTSSHTLGFLNEIRNYKRDIAVLQHWWQEDLSEDLEMQKLGNGNMNISLSYYLFLIGLEKSRLPDIYITAKQNILSGKSLLLDGFCLPSLPLSPVNKETFFVLDIIRTELGDQALKKITRPLYCLYKTQGSLQAAQFSQTVKNMLKTSPLPPEREAEIMQHLLTIEYLSAEPGCAKASPSLTCFSFDLEQYLP